MNKTTGIATLAIMIFSSKQYSQEPEIHRHNTYPIKVPAAVDGTPFGINGQEIKKLIYIIKEVEKLLRGSIDATSKQRIGAYTFQGNACSIHDLAMIEKNKNNFNAADKQKLQALLEQAKKDFIKIATPFIEQARGVKAITLKFMDEWATKHKREESHLMHWSKEKDGNEISTFFAETTSIKHLEEFCIDLISFISDLIQSCPRGWEQFTALQKGSQ